MSKKKDQKEPKEITLPSRKDYQPSKAEMEKEFDMPEADIETVRKTFFQPPVKSSGAERRLAVQM